MEEAQVEILTITFIRHLFYRCLFLFFERSEKRWIVEKLIQEELPKFSNVPRVVILKNQKLKGIAGYNRVDDTLYISDSLNSEESIKEILADG